MLTPERLLESLTYSDFVGWMEFYSRKPWGDFREDLRQSVLIEWLLHPWKKNVGKRPPNLVFPYWEQESKLSASEQLRWLELYDSALEQTPEGGYRLTVPIEELVDRFDGN